MSTNRLEAFSDGVLAIIITIMVLEMKVPQDATVNALLHLWPIFSSYVLSFIYVGIYWNNHHHMFQATEVANGRVLWANLHLLFWLSLLPFSTGWMGENRFEQLPVIVYGANLFLCAVAYYLLERWIIATEGGGSVLARAVGRDVKGKLSPVLYVAGICSAAFVAPWLGVMFYTAVAAMWFLPDRRIEKELVQTDGGADR